MSPDSKKGIKMKKIIIGLVIALAVIIILPIIGNSVATELIDTKINELKSNGLEVTKTSTDSSYFSTSKHYEIILKNADKFTTYLTNYTDKQIPANISMMIEGMVVGFDIKYDNFLFSDELEMEVYPLSLSTQATIELKKNNEDFYKYMAGFLGDKGLLYHIDYSVSSENFKGFVKDIDIKYSFKDATAVRVELKSMNFSGKGSLASPNNIKSSIAKMILHSTQKNDELEFVINGLSTSSNLKTLSTYKTSASIDDMKFKINAVYKTDIQANNIKMDFSADTEAKKAKFFSSSAIDRLSINSKVTNIILDNFKYDMGLTGVDKDAFEEFRTLMSKAQTSMNSALQAKIEKSMISMFSKGLKLNIKELSLKKVALNNQKSVEAFNFNALLNLEEDINMLNNINTNPMQMAKNIDLKSKLTLSKEFFKLLNKQVPLSAIATNFAKEVGDDYVFDLKFENSKLSVNGKKL